MSLEPLFLRYSSDKLRQSADRIEFCLGRLNDDQIWTRSSENENAIGNLVLHLAGNVRQWIIHSVGGAPFKRDRDAEFAARGGMTGAALCAAIRQTVDEAADVIERLTTAELARIYEIQNYRVSGIEAVYHVVEHFSYHTGQIIFATKMLKGEDLGFYRHLADSQHGERVP